jgi:hypothetical protein
MARLHLPLPEWVWALAYAGLDIALGGLLWLLIRTKEE